MLAVRAAESLIEDYRQRTTDEDARGSNAPRRCSTTRPIFVLHASGHLATVNSALLSAQGVTAATQTEGVAKDEQGEPTGELQETAILLAGPVAARIMHAAGAESTWWDFGRAALVGGVTTVTDLGVDILGQPDLRTLIAKVVNDPAFPARVVTYALPAAHGQTWDPAQVADAFHALRSQQTDRWRLGGIKLVADGSIQGWTAVLNPPGYRDGSPGIWMVSPEEMLRSVPVFHAAGINVHCHANGSAVIDAFCDAVDAGLRQVAWLDHRHTVQHAQLASDAQLRRMANLGMAANFFINHIAYWGDQHYELTVGPERANRMEPCASAIREGVRFSLHCDCNVTPFGGLQLMWSAVNRRTASGRVLGPEERISAYDALKAVTLDAAYQLHLDHQLGSLEARQAGRLHRPGDQPPRGRPDGDPGDPGTRHRRGRHDPHGTWPALNPGRRASRTSRPDHPITPITHTLAQRDEQRSGPPACGGGTSSAPFRREVGVISRLAAAARQGLWFVAAASGATCEASDRVGMGAGGKR